jgi:hypothetical protein
MAVGRVTGALHQFVHYTQWADLISYPLLLTSIVLPQTLQTALLDMFGASQGVFFEAQAGMKPLEAIVMLVSSSGGKSVPIFSGDQLGPDLSLLPFGGVQFWVQAHSVFLKDTVLWQVRITELMAIWDYEGKVESAGWSCIQSLHILKARLSAPPAKMLQCFAQSVCNAMLLRLDASCLDLSKNIKSTGLLGFTQDVPFSPLKEKVTTCVAAAQADDAKVDLLAWSLPQETAEEAKARVILCNFAVWWWAHNLKKGRQCIGGIRMK